MILFSGRNDNPHQQGVALILKKDVEKSLLEARFFGKQVRMTIIHCYAPTNDADRLKEERPSQIHLKEDCRDRTSGLQVLTGSKAHNLPKTDRDGGVLVTPYAPDGV